MKIFKICAKCSDLFSANLMAEGKLVGEYNGYVPNWFPNRHYGDTDYVELTIDVITGKILNWKKPSQAQLAETFKLKKE